MAYNEILKRGTGDFSIELYALNKNHPRYKMAHHWHSEFEVIRVNYGSLALSVDNGDYILNEGDIAFVNPEQVHGALPKECIYECIVFKPEAFFSLTGQTRAFLGDLFSGSIAINNILEDNAVKTAANKLFSALKESYSYSHFEKLAAIYSFFGEIVKNGAYKNHVLLPFSQCDKKILKLKKALLFIRKSYAMQLTLDEMAKEAEMSPKYFCAVFKELTQQTPFEYLINYRIERAASKLAETDASVTDIAFSSGFNDLSYFIKIFKKKTGLTPAMYRKGK